MKREQHWLEARKALWQDIESALPDLEDRRPITPDSLRSAVLNYPELARDVAIARRESPGSRVTRYLETVYVRLHRALYRPARNTRDDIAYLLTREIPDIVSSLRLQILSVSAGFILTALMGWLLVSSYPETVSLFASPGMIRTVEGGKLWTEGLLNITPSSVLSLEIFTNNIMVAITTVVLGALYGLGTIYIIGLNGFMIGGIFAFTAHHNLDGKLFEFILAHGVVELSVIAVAGAVGFSIGESLARPGHRSRTAAFRHACRRGAKLMALCCLFLVGAGLIEGYISPDPIYGMPVRWTVGFGYWFLFLFALRGWRIKRRQPIPDATA